MMPYFCQEQTEDNFKLASPAEGHPILERQASITIALAGHSARKVVC